MTAPPLIHREPLEELDVRASLHPYTMLGAHRDVGPMIVTDAEGVRVRDHRGKEYIDSMAGLWCVNAGWGRTEIADAMAEQARRLAFYHSFTGMANEPSIRLAAKLIELAPNSLGKVFFGCTGSDANDTNVKLVWYYHNLIGKAEKKKIIARERGYHGVTLAAASLSGLSSMHKNFDLPLPFVRHVTTPHHYRQARPDESERELSKRLARELDETIEREGADTVGAFIAEPVMGAGGVFVPPEGYFEEIVPVLRHHEVLFIADEVVCGFGRLGHWFGSDAYDLRPDLMTVAKGLTSGYVPMSASLVSEAIWQTMAEAEGSGYFAHGFTYSSHPVSAAAAIVNLDILESEGLVDNAARVGEHFQRRLREALAEHPHVGEVRGRGLIAAVELVRDKDSREEYPLELKLAPQLAKLALDEGLICRALPQSNALSFSPPLSINVEECDQIVERFARALDRMGDRLSA